MATNNPPPPKSAQFNLNKFSQLISSMFEETAPLSYLKHNNVQKLKELFDKGAITPNSNLHDNYKKSLFSYAVSFSRKDIAKLMLCYDADVNAVDEAGMTPLMISAALGHKDVHELLMEYKADPCPVDQKGRYAVDFARFYQNEDLAEALEQVTLRQCSGYRANK